MQQKHVTGSPPKLTSCPCDRLAATQIIEANLYEFMKSRVGVPQQGVCSAWAWFVGDDVAWSVRWQDVIRKVFK